MKRLGLLFVLAAVFSASFANEKGEALIKQINAVKMPKWQQGKENDKAFMAKYMAEIATATKKKNVLILQLYKADPNNPKTLGLMKERWMRFESGNVGDAEAYLKRIEADINAVLKTNPPAPIAEAGEAAKVRVQMDFGRVPNPIGLVDAFIKKYPKSEEGPSLLMATTYQLSGPARISAYQRFLEVYPDHKFSAMVKGALRQNEAVGKPFELTFTDAVTGKKFDMADMQGKVVIVDFWATWCGPCIAKMPEVKRVFDTYGKDGLEVVGISLDQPESQGGLKSLKEFVAKNSYPWWQYYQGNGWDSKFSTEWGIMSIPNVFLVDRKGILREISVRDLEGSVKRLLAEKE